MEGISDIRVTGIDETRPPKIMKEPYIDLYFRLSHKAPVDWCQDFNELLAKHQFSPKIRPDEGLYIETWVRNADEIAGLLGLLKETVAECTTLYIEKVALRIRDQDGNNALLRTEQGEQGRLNTIIAKLDFGK
jgi:hypothetical protein